MTLLIRSKQRTRVMIFLTIEVSYPTHLYNRFRHATRYASASLYIVSTSMIVLIEPRLVITYYPG